MKNPNKPLNWCDEKSKSVDKQLLKSKSNTSKKLWSALKTAWRRVDYNFTSLLVPDAHVFMTEKWDKKKILRKGKYWIEWVCEPKYDEIILFGDKMFLVRDWKECWLMDLEWNIVDGLYFDWYRIFYDHFNYWEENWYIWACCWAYSSWGKNGFFSIDWKIGECKYDDYSYSWWYFFWKVDWKWEVLDMSWDVVWKVDNVKFGRWDRISKVKKEWEWLDLNQLKNKIKSKK